VSFAKVESPASIELAGDDWTEDGAGASSSFLESLVTISHSGSSVSAWQYLFRTFLAFARLYMAAIVYEKGTSSAESSSEPE